MLQSFSQLKDKGYYAKKATVVIAGAEDAHSLEAGLEAAEKGFVDYLLVGDKARILKAAEGLEKTVDPKRIIQAGGDEESAQRAVDIIWQGQGDFLMKGGMQTAQILKVVVAQEKNHGNPGIMSHIALLEIPGHHKLLGMTDGGMIPYPTLEQKAAIVRNAVNLFHTLGNPCPKVGALCAVETVNPKMKETVEAAELKEMALSGQLGECLLEGPISLDLAVSREAAKIKGFESPVAGDADIFLVPDMSTGNILAKGLLFLAGAKMAGCIVGATMPVVINSRAASAEEKLYGLLLCAATQSAKERK